METERRINLDDKGLSKEQIFKADDKPLGWIDVPEWGGGLHLRTFTVEEREAIETHVSRAKATGQRSHTRGKVIAMGVGQANGARLFSDNDVALIEARSAIVAERVCNAILEHNGMTEKAREADAKN